MVITKLEGSRAKNSVTSPRTNGIEQVLLYEGGGTTAHRSAGAILRGLAPSDCDRGSGFLFIPGQGQHCRSRMVVSRLYYPMRKLRDATII